MDKFVVKGVKKLFGLTRTKIRLSCDAGTLKTMPPTLPLVKAFTGSEVSCVSECVEFLDFLRKSVDYESQDSICKTVLCLMDIIEGVKYEFEPPELMCLLTENDFKVLESRVQGGGVLNILLMDETVREGVNVYVGFEPPRDCIHLGRVVTNLAPYLGFALNSPILSENNFFRSVRIFSSQNTLIQAAVRFSLECVCL